MNRVLLLDRIKSLSRPLDPIPMPQPVRPDPVRDVRCVAFDFYGTMFLSGVGDIGVDEKVGDVTAEVREALREAGFAITREQAPSMTVTFLEEELAAYMKKQREAGIDYPEPDIVDIWQRVLRRLVDEEYITGKTDREAVMLFAIGYEFRVNAVWPVPNLGTTLEKLAGSVDLAIISNSQFYTPLTFESLMEKTLESAGFDLQISLWSYREGIKKPSAGFYRRFLKKLERKPYGPREVFYIGNDIRKDIAPARELGMKTGLFVGDRRSIRHSREELLKEAWRPDAIIDDIAQVSDCIS